MLKFKLLALANFHQNGTKNWIWPKCDMPAVIVFRSKPKMNCKSRLFCLFFLIHTLFRKVEWEESIIEGYEESRGAFPPFPSYSESDARNCSNNENEVNRVNRAEAAYVQHLFLFSILPTQRRRRTNERSQGTGVSNHRWLWNDGDASRNSA